MLQVWCRVVVLVWCCAAVLLCCSVAVWLCCYFVVLLLLLCSPCRFVGLSVPCAAVVLVRSGGIFAVLLVWWLVGLMWCRCVVLSCC